MPMHERSHYRQPILAAKLVNVASRINKRATSVNKLKSVYKHDIHILVSYPSLKALGFTARAAKLLIAANLFRG